jgi:hypothetical protein
MRQTVLDENFIVTVPRPPDGSGLVPSDSWLFGPIKKSLVDRVFNDGDELLEAAIEVLNEIQPSELRLVFHHWIELAKWV